MKKNKTLIIILSAFAAFTVIVSAVFTATWLFVVPALSKQDNSGEVEIVKQAKNNGTLKVGLLRINSGESANFGRDADNGADLAVEEINEKGVLGDTKIELIKEDTEGQADKAKTSAQKLVEQDKVKAFVGPQSSAEMVEASEVAQKAKVPMISPTATNTRATSQGDFIFSMAYTDAYQGELLAKYITKQGKKKVAILFNSDNPYSSGVKEAIKNKLEELKIETKVESFTKGTQDFTEQLQKFKSFGADALVLPEETGAILPIEPQARTILGNDIPFYGIDGMSGIAEVVKGDSFQNTFYINAFAKDAPRTKSSEFAVKFQKKYGMEATLTAAATYDAIYLIADAYAQAKGESSKLRDKISRTHKEYVIGDIQFTDKRFVKKQGYIIAIKKEGNLLKEVYQEDII